MVAISLTHDSAKEMANRLRQFLAAGGISIKQTHAYEALAKSLGYRDWNTLLGALQASGSTSQDVTVGATASSQSPTRPATLLLIDRHAMAAHGVTAAQIESAFRREFPELLAKRTEWETLCYEQLPPRQLPPFRPPIVSLCANVLETADPVVITVEGQLDFGHDAEHVCQEVRRCRSARGHGVRGPGGVPLGRSGESHLPGASEASVVHG